MLIRLTNLPKATTDIHAELEHALADAGLVGFFHISPLAPSGQEVTRGDPATIATILLTAVGTGGALAIAMGKDGFLTRLAHVLERTANRRVDITIELNRKKSTPIRLCKPHSKATKDYSIIFMAPYGYLLS
jgi:hypothetical protein